MQLSSLNRRRDLKPIIGILVLCLLLAPMAGCEYPAPLPSPTPTPRETSQTATRAFVNTADKAIQAVYEYLLSKASGYKAKLYLAEFYTTCDRWSAESELLKDGTTVWHVVIDMKKIEGWQGRSCWREASWLVYQGGRVLPSFSYQANALRIEADLEELSLQSK